MHWKKRPETKTKSKIKLKSENTELIQKIESMASREGEGEATRGVNDNRRASSLSRYDEAQALGGHGVVGDVSSPQRYQSFSYREQVKTIFLQLPVKRIPHILMYSF